MFPWVYNQVRPFVRLALILGIFFLTPTLSLAAQTTLAWDSNDPTPDGYRIYHRIEGQAYDYSQPAWTGSATNGTVYNLDYDTTYYFVVRAYAGTVESTDSNEVSFFSTAPVIPTYTISATAGENGTISPEGTVTVNEGASQTFIISPDAGFHVEEVIVDGASKGAVTSYTLSQITANHTISASFAVNVYTISATAGANGIISPEGIVNIDHGSSQTFTITPAAGYHVMDVKVDGLSKGSVTAYTFNQVTTNRSIEATFSYDTYTVPKTAQATLAWDPNDPTPDGYRIYQRIEGQAYNYNQPVWTGSETTGTVYNLEYDTTYYFVVRAFAGTLESADSSEVSFFAQAPPPATHTITVVAGNNGVVSPGNTVTITRGSDQTFTISPDSGCHVANVNVDGVSVGVVQAYTFTQVSANHTFSVSFAVDTYTISASAGPDGTISSTGVVSVNHGASKTYTITPNTGYQVADVLVDGVSMGVVNSYTFDTVVTAHTITASFAVDAYTISAFAGANGSILPAGIIIVDAGASKTYTITPNTGYQVADVLVDGVSMGVVNSYTFDTVVTDHTINATFEPDTFTITVASGTNGTITPAGPVDVAYGASQTFVFAADAGFHIADVQVDGQSMGVMGNYTFTDVKSDHTLVVSFSENTLVKIWIEAEDGDLQSPMEIADDEKAGACSFIWVPEGTGNLSSPSENAGHAEYHFEIPETGDYVIWGLQISNNTAGDSFFVSVDGQSDMVWHTKPGGQDVWTWDVFALRDASNPDYAADSMQFRLEAGPHTLKITQREDGTKLDKILITNQKDLTHPEPNSVVEAMEYDEVELNHTWTRINYKKVYVNPVIVTGPISLNGGHPAVVRIRSVDAAGFEIRIQEWGYLDGSHLTETVSYLVMEQGNYTLGNGTQIEAATIETSAAASFQPITFNEKFNVAPVVMTTVTSFNDSTTVTGRMKKITVDGFNHRMQEQEGNVQDHGTERLSYIAWEPSSGTMVDTTYLVEKTADTVSHRFHNIDFENPFALSPTFLADMQTADGENTANVRYANKDGFSVDVLIDEEQSQDNETNHTKEVVGVMVFNR